MRPGDSEPDRDAMVTTLRRIAEKPTDFSFAEISAYASLAADMLEPRSVSKKSKVVHADGQRTIDDEEPGVIKTKGRPSAHDR